MLTKENGLIRKELDSTLLGKKPANHESFDAKGYEIEDLKTENSHLKSRIKHLEEMLKGKSEGRVNIFFLYIKITYRNLVVRWVKKIS